MFHVKTVEKCEDCPALHLLIQGDGHICNHPLLLATGEGMIINLILRDPPPPECPLRKKDLRLRLDARLYNKGLSP